LPAVPVTLADVEAAATRLHDVAVRTPVLTSPALDEQVGAAVFCKYEGAQHTGSFKFRGAFNKLASLTDAQRARGVIAASSGNHAQALALAAARFGAHAVVFMPADAPAAKRDAAVALGAEIVEYDRYHDDRDAMVHERAQRDGLALVHSSSDPVVVAGQGTVARELLEAVGPLDLIAVPVAGGGLLGGTLVVAGAQAPPVRVVGVEPTASPDLRESLRRGELVHIPAERSIADALLLGHPSPLGYELARARLTGDDVVLVDDDEILDAVRFAHRVLGVVVEPGGAAALAALLAGRFPGPPAARVGIVLSGANVGTDRFAQFVEPA
jgi:threonine dehydratase